MTYETAVIDINPGMEDHVQLLAIPFHFNPGERSLYTGADATGAVIHRAGWLGLRTEPFKLWQSAHIISVTGKTGTDLVFEVKRNFNVPMQDGEWLWFPATPQTVETFKH